jgi:hypothetical protein
VGRAGLSSRRQAAPGRRLATDDGKSNLQVSSGLTRGDPAHEFASITSTAPGQRHHGGHEVASSSSPGCVAHTARPTVQAGTRTLVGPADPLRAGLRSLAWRLDTATGSPAGLELASHPRGRHRVLTWCPGGRGSGTTCRASTATRTHGCGGMGPGRSGRRTRSWGALGARTDSIQQTITDSPSKRMPW